STLCCSCWRACSNCPRRACNASFCVRSRAHCGQEVARFLAITGIYSQNLSRQGARERLPFPVTVFQRVIKPSSQQVTISSVEENESRSTGSRGSPKRVFCFPVSASQMQTALFLSASLFSSL